MKRNWIAGLALAALLLGAFLFFAAPGFAEKKPQVFQRDGLALGGTDVVAYFNAGRAVAGSAEFEAEWNDATWRFSSAENRTLFLADPELYAPQYGGYCAFAVAKGYTAKTEPEAWRIVEGRLFLNYNLSVRERWEAKRDEFIESADENWPTVLDD